MESPLVQSIGAGAGAATIAARVETLIAAGQLQPGERLPPVRALATGLGVSPATVAAGYRNLRDRGRADAKPGRERADRGQPLTRPELARSDQRLDAGGDGCCA